jgi:hypothetical protein
MITYYPSNLLPYLSLKLNPLPSYLSSLYYLSWEDALWDLLPQLGVEPGATILLPNFYCIDVIVNIKQHGYQVSLYPLDKNFQISEQTFLSIYKHLKPAVVIIFHALGITSQLMTNQSLIQQICKDSILIEDQVHRIINPQRLHLHHPHHLIMDSLRKNLPLPGSFVYLTPLTASRIKSPRFTHPLYVFRVAIYYLLYQLTLILGQLLHNRSLIAYADNQIMTSHDNLVGDSQRGNRGLPLISRLHSYLNHSKISHSKLKQVNLYRQLLSELTHPALTIPSIDQADLSQLHAYPFIVSTIFQAPLDLQLNHLNVWPKFPDSPWSESKLVYCLPLGMHVSEQDQHQIVSALLTACQKA